MRRQKYWARLLNAIPLQGLQWYGASPAFEPTIAWRLMYGVVIVLIADMIFFFTHLMMHRTEIGWALHKVHHSAAEPGHALRASQLPGKTLGYQPGSGDEYLGPVIYIADRYEETPWGLTPEDQAEYTTLSDNLLTPFREIARNLRDQPKVPAGTRNQSTDGGGERDFRQ